MLALLARCALLALLALATVVLVPGSARAWTRTDVRGMRARAEVLPSGVARIGLEVTIEVQGGWVERFEIAGLGQGATLDPLKPPTWTKVSPALDDTDAVAGQKYLPEVRLRDDGTLTLDFGAARARAPKRGTYRSHVVYETRLSSDGRGALVVTLPTWPSALENVELWIDAPRGTAILPANDADHDLPRVLERGALTTARVHKPQLPRTHPLEARLILPGMAAPLPGVAAPVQAPRPVQVERASATPSGQTWLIALILLTLIALKRASTAEPSARPERAFTLAKGTLIALACAFFPFADAWSPAAGLAALVLAVALGLSLPGPLHPRALGRAHYRYRPAGTIDLERARRARLEALLGPRTWLDATTPAGLTLLTALGALSWLSVERSGTAQDAPFLIAWAAALPLFLVRTRFARAPGAGDALRALGAVYEPLVAAARELGASARLEVACASTTGVAEHARLRIAANTDGASELSLVLAQDGRGMPVLAWLIAGGGRTVLRRAADPLSELPALLRDAPQATAAKLADAA